MASHDESDPFAGTAAYYAEHRPGYGTAAVEHLLDRFDLDGSARVLDLGCGTGQIAVPLAAHVGEVVGMDPNEAMLLEARRRAREAGVDDVEWVAGSDATLGGVAGPLRLTTMGRSFHWMDRERTLQRLYEIAEPDGGVALLSDREWLTKGPEEWQAAVHAVADRYVEDLPDRTAPEDVSYERTWADYLQAAGFADVTVEEFPVERGWTVGSVVGYVRSLSFCSSAVLGDDRDAFERDLRARLADLGGGPFRQAVPVEVTSGCRRPE